MRAGPLSPHTQRQIQSLWISSWIFVTGRKSLGGEAERGPRHYLATALREENPETFMEIYSGCDAQDGCATAPRRTVDRTRSIRSWIQLTARSHARLVRALPNRHHYLSCLLLQQTAHCTWRPGVYGFILHRYRWRLLVWVCLNSCIVIYQLRCKSDPAWWIVPDVNLTLTLQTGCDTSISSAFSAD